MSTSWSVFWQNGSLLGRTFSRYTIISVHLASRRDWSPDSGERKSFTNDGRGQATGEDELPTARKVGVPI